MMNVNTQEQQQDKKCIGHAELVDRECANVMPCLERVLRCTLLSLFLLTHNSMDVDEDSGACRVWDVHCVLLFNSSTCTCFSGRWCRLWRVQSERRALRAVNRFICLYIVLQDVDPDSGACRLWDVHCVLLIIPSACTCYAGRWSRQ